MAVATASEIERTGAAALLERDLIYVTGKGGAGKTTVAAALALAGRASARRTLVCEVDGAQRRANAFARGNPAALSIEPHTALTEWMRRQPGGVIAAATLGRSRAFRDFVAAAPGAKELVTIGKAVDLARSDAYDFVIVDGPSTGHATAMLAAPRTVGRMARAGPVGEQARKLHAFLADASHTALVGVSLPEEMSLHELLELDAGLHEAVGRGLDLVVVDGVYPDRFSDAEVARLERLAGEVGQVRSALIQHRRARLHAERVRELRRRAPAPVLTLPFVFETELHTTDYELFARRLATVRS